MAKCELLHWDVNVLGQKLGTLIIEKDDLQKTIILTFNPDPNLEIRTSDSNGKGRTEITFKAKEG